MKNITTLEGGAITTNSKKIYEKLILLRNHSLKRTKIDDPYVLFQPTLNFRMPEICALVGLNQLKLLNEFKKQRQKLLIIISLKLPKSKNF